MFTGLVESVGTVATVEPAGDGRRLEIAVGWADELEVGQSVAVDGACLTAAELADGAFVAEAVAATVGRTIIGSYAAGRRVHLERALAVGDRLGGHFVQGHVDDVATVASIERSGENRYISLDVPAAGRRLVAPRGSIAVNGVSLTIQAVTPAGVRLSIIPHTWRATTFAELAPGDRVNVEYDVIARYLQRLMETRE